MADYYIVIETSMPDNIESLYICEIIGGLHNPINQRKKILKVTVDELEALYKSIGGVLKRSKTIKLKE